MDVLSAQLQNLGFNATLASTAPAAPLMADLYSGVDVAALNIFERAWMNWYLWIGNPAIATGLMSFLMHGEQRDDNVIRACKAPYSYITSFFLTVQKSSTLDVASRG